MSGCRHDGSSKGGGTGGGKAAAARARENANREEEWPRRRRLRFQSMEKNRDEEWALSSGGRDGRARKSDGDGSEQLNE